ncbi:MAG TPA: hypothetical protein VKA21_09855 [Candidatus Binatia bacterium]|nr:hypothetical protein [Candidatus Binatia bacterium]
MTIDWRRVTLTEHMTEAAAVVGELQVVLDFGAAPIRYEMKVWQALKGAGDEAYFALGTNADDPAGFRPFGNGATPEAALDACLSAAGIHHRRLVKQAGE